MTLTPEQKEAVSAWIASGDNLSVVQKKLIEQFQITLTYRDVRFLVDDLNLALQDPAPKVDTSDVSKAVASSVPAGKPNANSTQRRTPEQPQLGIAGESTEQNLSDDIEPPLEEGMEDLPAGSTVAVEVDKVTLLPGALASGTVTFSDGVTGKWVVDQYGRPGFTEVSQPGYRPSPADGQAFMRELSAQLQRRGF